MCSLIITALASLSIFPLNPAQDDTVNVMNLHFTAGVVSPSELISLGPEFTLKYEFLLSHPFVLRTGFDYRFGRMKQLKYPQGDYQGFTISAECLHYRGSHRMKGIIGAGIVYNYSSVSLDDRVADSIMAAQQIADVRVEPHFGYRIILGLRRSDLWSFELRVTDIRTNLVYQRDLAPNRFSLERQRFKLSDVRVSFGYLLPLLKM
jgi:hypothetical protein